MLVTIPRARSIAVGALCYGQKWGKPRTIVAQQLLVLDRNATLEARVANRQPGGVAPTSEAQVMSMLPSSETQGQFRPSRAQYRSMGHPGMKITIRGLSFPIRLCAIRGLSFQDAPSAPINTPYLPHYCNLVSTPLHSDSACPPTLPTRDSPTISEGPLLNTFRPISTCGGTQGT